MLFKKYIANCLGCRYLWQNFAWSFRRLFCRDSPPLKIKGISYISLRSTQKKNLWHYFRAFLCSHLTCTKQRGLNLTISKRINWIKKKSSSFAFHKRTPRLFTKHSHSLACWASMYFRIGNFWPGKKLKQN